MRKTLLIFHFAWHEVIHGWRHFRVFLACLLLGVTVMAAVNSVGVMIKYAFQQEAKGLLGGDLEVRLTGKAATKQQRDYFNSLGQVSYVSSMRSMARVENGTVLVEIKAIDEFYPLVGNLQLNQTITKEDALVDNGVIIDETLLSQLGIKLGDKIAIGNAEYTIRATLKAEPDRAVQLFSFGPRVMLSHKSLQATGLIGQLSLILHHYRILLSSNPNDIGQYGKSVEKYLFMKFPNNSWRVKINTDGSPAAERFINQLVNFLNLSALATFLIAGIGIASSVRAYLEKKLPTIAMLKILGGERLTILFIYLLILGILATAGGGGGIVCGILILKITIPILVELIPSLAKHNDLHFFPLLLAFWYGILVTYIFSLPALLNALDTRAANLFRSKSAILKIRLGVLSSISVGVLLSLLMFTLIIVADDKLFILIVLGMFALSFGVFYLCAVLVRLFARKYNPSIPWLRLAFGNLYRPGNSTGTVVYAIGISLTILISLILTEANFQERLKEIIEEDAPSLFMIDVQPYQKNAIADILTSYATPGSIKQKPMIRGRITHRNGAPISAKDVDASVRWAIRGDRGLSYGRKKPEGAVLSAGQWWAEDYNGKPLLSVDERFMSGMKLSLGDTLTLNILGEKIVATIANARKIDYSTMQINFSLMLSPGVLEDFPQTFPTTVHLKDPRSDEVNVVKIISRQFPGVTIIRTTEVVEIIKGLMEKIAIALRFAVGISLFAGILVLSSALAVTLEQRVYDIAILKVMGARRVDIIKTCFIEWGILSIATCLIASIIGTISSWLILIQLRSQHFDIMPHITLVSILICFLVVSVTGYLGNKRLFKLRTANLLRNE